MKIRAWKVRLRFLAVIAAAMWILAGCSMYGAPVDTQLKVNEDLSGVRVMDVTIPATMVSGNSPVTIDILNRLIEENCPQELVWSYEKNGNTDQYHVELAFDSQLDYMMKVKVITGKSVQLEMEASDSVWKKGIRVVEDFTSADLLAWLKDAMVSEELVSADMADRIFRAGSTELVYGDRSYKTDFAIRVDEMVKAPLEKIDVLTAVKAGEQFDRDLVIYVPQASMEANGDELKAYLDGMVPPDAVSEWGLYGNGATLTIRKENLSLSELDAFTKAATAVSGAAQGGIAVSEKSPGTSVFVFTDQWKEELDLSAYGCEDGETVHAGYYVKAEDGIGLTGVPESGADQAAEVSAGYDGYRLVSAERTDRLEAEFELVRTYRAEHTEIRTTVEEGNVFEREIRLTLQDMPEGARREQIAERLRERAAAAADDGVEAGADAKAAEESADAEAGEADDADAGAKEENADVGAADAGKEAGANHGTESVGVCEISTEESEDGFAVIISMEGEALVITELSGRILGGTTEISWKTEGGPFSIRKKFSYAETADYSGFFADAAEDHSITYVIDFEGFGGSIAEPDGKVMKTLEARGITRKVSGRAVTLQIKGTAYEVAETGSSVNVPGIILWIVIILLAVIAIAAAVKFGAARKVKDKADIRQLQDKMDEEELRRATEAADRAEAKAREAAMQLAGQMKAIPLSEGPEAEEAAGPEAGVEAENREEAAEPEAGVGAEDQEEAVGPGAGVETEGQEEIVEPEAQEEAEDREETADREDAGPR